MNGGERAVADFLYGVDSETASPETGVLLAGHFIKSFGYFGHRSNGTRDWLMIYTVSGEGHFRVHEQTERSYAGDMVILPPGIPHHYATPAGCEWELMWVHFVPMPEWHTWLQLPRTDEQLIHIQVETNARVRLRDAFARLIADSRRHDPLDLSLAMIALSEVLALLYRQIARQQGEMLDKRIEAVIRHMSDHLHEPHNTQDLADLAGLSVSRLCHLFKDQVGETITGRLNRMRLEKASRLLALTPWKIQDIARDTGFESAYYFTRLFTRHFGKSPTDYRKRAMEKWRFTT